MAAKQTAHSIAGGYPVFRRHGGTDLVLTPTNGVPQQFMPPDDSRSTLKTNKMFSYN
jgi:hypothetical protein